MAYLILVVDDDPKCLQDVNSFLSIQGMEVIAATNGEEALQCIESVEKIDLVLLDIGLPGINGNEVCRQIRLHYSLVELPVIMLTANSETQVLVQSLNSGANDYLIKPFVKEELLARVQTQIKIKNACLALSENQLLKKEIRQRQQTEHDLRFTQRRLGALLDSIPEVVLAVNESGEINFLNYGFRQLTGYSAADLLGLSLDKVFTEKSKQQLKIWLDQMNENVKLKPKDLSITFFNKTQHVYPIYPKSLELEEEQLLMLVVQTYPGRDDQDKTPVAWSVIESLNQHRIRLHMLEGALIDFIPQLETEHPEFINTLHDVELMFDQLTHSLSSDSEVVDRQFAIVNTMKLVIDYWCESTQTNKAELAHKSGLWKVYTNEDGWNRTQTLDRYLSIETLPKYPRLKLVIRTAEFVLANCHPNSELRHDLEYSLVQLRKTKLT